MKKALIIPSRGIGDGLIVMIFSKALREKGLETTTLHPLLYRMKSWFPNERIEPILKENLTDRFLLEQDLIVVQNDNSPFIQRLYQLKKEHPQLRLKVLYPSFNPEKHRAATPDDVLFNETETMVKNVAVAASAFLNSPLSCDNGLVPLSETLFRKQKQRVLIHPLSQEERKNWPLHAFLTLANHLKKRGFDPHFLTEKKEEALLHSPFSYHYGLSLEEAAKMIYESGYVIGNDSFACHLSSSFNIPFCVIADCESRLKLWKPGWGKGAIVTTPFPYKHFRFCQRRWQRFISARRVLKHFQALAAFSPILHP